LTEIVARLPRPRGSLRALQLLVLAAGAALVAAGVVALRPGPQAVVHVHVRPAAAPARTEPPRHVAAPAPRPADPRLAAALADDAAHGLDRGLFTASPGGIVATAARVAAWRPLIARAVRGSGFSPSLLEALVFVESSGRADATSGGAAGLTQLSASAARHVHLRVRIAKSGRLTGRIDRAEARGSRRTARQLRRWRARFDQRFAPARELRAAVRRLTEARARLGRVDLALAAYHLGAGNVAAAVAADHAEGTPSYAELYFGSAPDHRRGVWLRLRSGGDYYWKVLAAKRVMRLWRHDPAALAYEAQLQARKNSAEEVMHPRPSTPKFATPRAIARAWKHHVLRAIPRPATRTHIAIGSFVGEEAHKLGRSARLYRGLRPATLDALLYIGRRVHELSHARKPLLVTSAVRDLRYQRVLMRVNANAARSYSLHTTGYAFDIARSYANRRQAAAFEFVLDRLEAVGAIAYIREAAAIHVAVASDAPRKLRLLERS
jgi:uncharacterized protein YcbK (DUF882 family)